MSVLIVALILSGCSALSLLPKKHDPVEAMYLVETKVAVDALSCDNDDGWDSAMTKANLLATYAAYRKEVQVENAKSIGDNLVQAKNNPITCSAFLKVSQSRLDILYEVWGNRR